MSTSKSTSQPLLARLARMQDKLDLLDAGVDADEVVDVLRRRRLPVKELTLSHNPLGDAGLARLLSYLRSSSPSVSSIRSLQLNATGLGDGALLALARHFSRSSGQLEELFLQVNLFTGSAYPLATFARSLSLSHLRRLYLSSNALGDAGVSALLSALSSPRLRELHLSATGLTDACAPALCEYLASRRSAGLRVLKMNGNALGREAMGMVVRVVDDAPGNWGLEKVEVWANDVPDGDKVLLRLGALLDRNRILRGETRRSALHLLRIARIALFHPRPAPFTSSTSASSSASTSTSQLASSSASFSYSSSSPPSTSTALILRDARTPLPAPARPASQTPPPALPASRTPSPLHAESHEHTPPATTPPPAPTSAPPTSSPRPPPVIVGSIPWLALPYELRLLVLRFAVPHCALSAGQCARVCAYAEGGVEVLHLARDGPGVGLNAGVGALSAGSGGADWAGSGAAASGGAESGVGALSAGSGAGAQHAGTGAGALSAGSGAGALYPGSGAAASGGAESGVEALRHVASWSEGVRVIGARAESRWVDSVEDWLEAVGCEGYEAD